MISNSRWYREISIPLAAEEVSALLGNNPNEKRDKSGKWTAAGKSFHEVLEHHGYKNTGQSEGTGGSEYIYEHSAGHVVSYWSGTDPDDEDIPEHHQQEEVAFHTPAGQEVGGAADTEHYDPKSLNKHLEKLHGAPPSLPPSTSSKKRGKFAPGTGGGVIAPFPKPPSPRTGKPPPGADPNLWFAAREIDAMLNGVVAGSSFTPGLGVGGTSEPQAKMCAPNCDQPHPWHGGKAKKAKLDGGRDVSGEARDEGGRWSKSGAPGSQHGSKKNMIRQNAESHAAGASKLLGKPDVGSKPAELVRAAQKIADHKRGGIDALTPAETNAWHAHVQGGIEHDGRLTDLSIFDPPANVHVPGMRIRPYKDRNKPWPDLHEAAEAVALLAAGPHDVSGESRDKGQFAKTPGAGGKPEPTGSPLDPATGVKPPPEPHEIHKSNMDYHQKAAKALQSMVKQHLDLGKMALNPEDRQNHIAQARQMKQLAAQHITEAGVHAQKMSEALKQKAMQPQATGQGALGNTAPPVPTGNWPAPINPSQTLKPKQQSMDEFQKAGTAKPQGKLPPGVSQDAQGNRDWSGYIARGVQQRDQKTRDVAAQQQNQRQDEQMRRADIQRSLGIGKKPKSGGPQT